MRIALGARRSRLIRQLLTESLVLASAGGLLGVALAHSVVHALRGIVPPGVLARSRSDLAIDGSVLIFTLVITAFATVAFGVGPAMRLSSVASASPLGGATRRLTGTARDRRLRAALVVVETALSLGRVRIPDRCCTSRSADCRTWAPRSGHSFGATFDRIILIV
jgi:hypothetical protein